VKASTTGSILAIAMAAVGALVLIVSRSSAVEAVYPVERASQVASTGLWPRLKGFFRGSAAAAENLRLKREVARLGLLQEDFRRLEEENARLRRALGYRASHSNSWLAAGVLSRGGGAVGSCDSLRIDKGSLAGVKAGAIVAVPEGLVGRVASVTPHTSEVRLITDPALRVACEIAAEGGTRAHGILYGGGEEILVIRHLKNGESASPRSRVLTSGRGGVFPRGLAIGTLLDVRKDARGFSQEGEVLPQVVFSTLEDVFIRCER